MDKEKVLVFPAGVINEQLYKNGIITSDIVHNLNIVLNSGQLFYKDRQEAESDPSFKQIIPYCIIYLDGKIFRYERTKKGGESRLHDLHSLGIGGHINPIDGNTFDQETIIKGMYREMLEEINNCDGKFSPIALIYDNSNDVGKVHFGIVYRVDITTHNMEFNDGSLSNGRFDTLQNIDDDKFKFENWSKIIIGSGVLNG